MRAIEITAKVQQQYSKKLHKKDQLAYNNCFKLWSRAIKNERNYLVKNY